MLSNSSYMASRHIGACSGAFVLKCTRTKQKAMCASAEAQPVSDNYSGELLGAIGFLSVIHAVLSHPSSKPHLAAAKKVKQIKAWTDTRQQYQTQPQVKPGPCGLDIRYPQHCQQPPG